MKSGQVRVVKDGKMLCQMGPQAIFGETGVLYGGTSQTSAAVIADSDEVKVSQLQYPTNLKIMQIEVVFMWKLFESEHALAMKFYKSIAIKMSNRLRNARAMSTASQIPNLVRKEGTIGIEIQTKKTDADSLIDSAIKGDNLL